MNRGSLTRKLCLGVLVCIVAFLLNPGCAHNRDVVRLEPIMPPPEPAIIVEETSEATPLREGYIVPVEHPEIGRAHV